MRRLHKVLLVILVVGLVIASIVTWYIMQYDKLEVDADAARSGYEYTSADELELKLVLRLTNTGSVDLYVPPTSFDAYVDGVFIGPGTAEKVTVPSGGSAWTTAILHVNALTAPAAYAALVDLGVDTITLIGEAFVDVGPITFDYPFEETFKMQV